MSIYRPFPLEQVRANDCRGWERGIGEQTPTFATLQSPILAFDTPSEKLCVGISFARDLSLSVHKSVQL